MKEFFHSVSLLSILRRIVNMACFYGGWFICMHEAVGSTPLLGPAIVAALLVYHMATTNCFRVDLILILTLSLIGTIVDSLYISIGMLSYEGGYVCCPSIAPLWITSLWALYASSVNHSLEWLKIHMLLVAAPLGAAGAISSYLVGFELEAAIYHYPLWVTLCVIGGVWAIVVPWSLSFSNYLRSCSKTSIG